MEYTWTAEIKFNVLYLKFNKPDNYLYFKMLQFNIIKNYHIKTLYILISLKIIIDYTLVDWVMLVDKFILFFTKTEKYFQKIMQEKKCKHILTFNILRIFNVFFTNKTIKVT